MNQVESRPKEARISGVEVHSIDPIPDSERHGLPRSLFTIWFATNVQITAAATGAIAVALGLPLAWAVLALLIGNLFGGLFMAFHSAQGPKLGVPQMIQSRAQFGFYGASIPLLLVVLMYIGYYAATAVLGGSALSTWWGIPSVPATIIVAAACALLAVYGYDAIHRYQRWVSLISGLGFLYLSIRLLQAYNVPAHAHTGHFALGTFVLAVALSGTWQITYAPYVADYSRYLPRATSVPATFWWTYAGSVLGAAWIMSFGAVVAAIASSAFNNGSVAFVVDLAPTQIHWLILLILILGVIATNVLNLYGLFMSVTTTGSSIKPFRVTRKLRATLVLAGGIVGTGIAVIASGNFLTNFSNFILFLAYFLIPWTTINLVDFYFLRKQHYDISAIFDPHGIYGAFNWTTLISYFVAIACEIPFVNSTFFVGPMVSHLGGADISWIIGLVVAGLLYYFLERRNVVPAMVPSPSDTVTPV